MNNKFSTEAPILRGGILGFGNIGPVHFSCVMGSAPNSIDSLDIANITAVADIVPERLSRAPEGMAAYGHFNELIEQSDVDVVHICLPHHLHAPASIAAAEAGKHIICEKPMALNAKEARQIKDACLANNVTFGLISQNRLNPEKRWIKDLCTAGRLNGLVRSDFVVDWFRSSDYYAEGDGWRGRETFAHGGALTNQAYHTLDLILWFVNEPVVAVCATTQTRKEIHPDIDVADTISGRLRFANDVKSDFFVTTCGDPSDSIRISLTTNGADPKRVLVNGNEIVEQTIEKEMPDFSEDESPLLGKACYGISHQQNIALIYEAIRQGTPPPIQADDGIRALEVIDAILTSNGQEVPMRSGLDEY